MTERAFEEVPIQYGERTAKALQITCSSCSAKAYFPHQTGESRKPPVAASQSFRNKNWVVGNHPRNDLCPECAKRRKPKKEHAMKDQASASGADRPREITREERRIINDKLDEVYGTGGYKTPWTDSAVAKDLGVPRDWVAQVREAFFGAAGSNPLFDDFLAENERMEFLRKNLAAQYDAAVKAYGDYAAGFKELNEAMKAQALTARRIEREIGR